MSKHDRQQHGTSFLEYDSQVALDDATIEKIVGDDGGKKSDGVLTVTFPHSAVLYLRSNKNTGDVMTIRFVDSRR